MKIKLFSFQTLYLYLEIVITSSYESTIFHKISIIEIFAIV